MAIGDGDDLTMKFVSYAQAALPEAVGLGDKDCPEFLPLNTVRGHTKRPQSDAADESVVGFRVYRHHQAIVETSGADGFGLLGQKMWFVLGDGGDGFWPARRKVTERGTA